MVLILKRENLHRMVLTWPYLFAPRAFNYRDWDHMVEEKYELLLVEKNRGYYLFLGTTDIPKYARRLD